METRENKKNFAVIGVGGYIAPRHLQAIKETGNELVAALDPHDSVGILDRYFPEVQFFTEFERFDRYIEKLRQQGEDKKIHYVSICSPNYLHDAHIRFALRIGADAICEKPLVLAPWNLQALSKLEKESGKRVFTVLQLRLHPTLFELKKKIENEKSERKYEVTLTYITPRGPWYHVSWKGDKEKSGGVATNIGVHFFDMLLWIFGVVKEYQVHYLDEKKASGYLELEKANVRWFLSIDKNDLPDKERKDNKAFRLIAIDGIEMEFSEGFTDLHTAVYKDILNGGGFGIKEVGPSIELVHNIRQAAVKINDTTKFHPYLKI